ncbi:MAG: AgmX/PglI C-terminal domain-containing protein [Gammaproteobacteria bacterium]
MLAFRNNLANLLKDTPEAKLGASANLSNKGSVSKHVTRHILTSQAKGGSGGIHVSSLSHNVSGTGKKMAAVAFTRVKSDIGTAASDDRPVSDGPGPSRTDEEIQIVFDRYKAALYRIYNRELRVNPTLQGRLVMRITIQPDGSVSKCTLASTNLASSKLVQKILARVRLFNFGKKAGVPPVTILYPIDFLPAS